MPLSVGGSQSSLRQATPGEELRCEEHSASEPKLPGLVGLQGWLLCMAVLSSVLPSLSTPHPVPVVRSQLEVILSLPPLCPLPVLGPRSLGPVRITGPSELGLPSGNQGHQGLFLTGEQRIRLGFRELGGPEF